MNAVRGIESIIPKDPRKEEYKTCLGDTIYSFKKQFGAELTPDENETVKSWKKEERIKVGHRWFKIKKSSSPDGVITPYLTKVSNQRSNIYGVNPSDYSIAELGVVCGLYGKDNGVICTVYPNLYNLVQAYDVRFRSSKALYRLVQDVISQIEDAGKSNDISSLPECPDYFCDINRCLLYSECIPE